MLNKVQTVCQNSGCSFLWFSSGEMIRMLKYLADLAIRVPPPKMIQLWECQVCRVELGRRWKWKICAIFTSLCIDWFLLLPASSYWNYHQARELVGNQGDWMRNGHKYGNCGSFSITAHSSKIRLPHNQSLLPDQMGNKATPVFDWKYCYITW